MSVLTLYQAFFIIGGVLIGLGIIYAVYSYLKARKSEPVAPMPPLEEQKEDIVIIENLSSPIKRKPYTEDE